jgi:hypothetical protein
MPATPAGSLQIACMQAIAREIASSSRFCSRQSASRSAGILAFRRRRTTGMPIALSPKEDGKILVVELVGTLVKEDYKPLVQEFNRLVGMHGKISVLLDMTRFEGWDMAALWQEIKFDLQHLDKMERLAVVGEKRWQHAIASAGKAFFSAEVRYFDAADAAQARQWIGVS